jgi:glutamate carboxypeptidase
MKNATFLFTLLYCFTVSAASLDAIETALVEQINKDMPRSESELEQVVNINSGTMNFAGVKEVGLLFKAQFEELGFDSEWIEGADFDRAGHLLATYGSKGPKILMIGHLDTVFAKEDSFQAFKRIDESHVAGPGITDMKGGDVIIVSALRALKNQGLLDRVSIKVVMTGDEERSGRPLQESKKALLEAAEWADIALGFEDGDGNVKTVVVARRGSIGWELEVSGQAAHSSQIFTQEIGYGAIFEASRILNTFREQLAGVGNITFNPGLIIGGTRINYDPQLAAGTATGKSNVVAQSVKIVGDLRVLTEQELDKAKQVMEKIVTNNLAHTSATLTFEEGYPPMAPTEGNYTLLKQFSDVSEDLGYGAIAPVDPRKAGAADISFTAGYVDMAIDGMGLMGTGGHTKDEVADMSSFAKNIHKAAILIYRLSQVQ